MEAIIKVGGVSIKASPAKDKQGRKGYFIYQRNLNTPKISIQEKKSKSLNNHISFEVEQSLQEMRDYKNGKLTPRSIDEVLRSI